MHRHMTRSEDARIQPSFWERIHAGRRAAEAQDILAAEEIFLAALSEARGAHTGSEVLALQSLTTLYGRTGRLFEALALSRHTQRLAARPGMELARAHAQAQICCALHGLELHDLLEPELGRLEPMIRRVPPRDQPDLRMEFLSLAIGDCLRLGNLEGSREYLREYEAMQDQARCSGDIDRFLVQIYDSTLRFHEGSPRDALEILEKMEAEGAIPPFRQLQILHHWIRCLEAVDRHDEASQRSEQGLALLERVQDEPQLCGIRLQGGLRLASLFEQDDRDPVRAQRAYELVAACVVLRIGQIDRAMQAVPELGLDAGEQELVRHRREFLRRHTHLLGHVARMLENNPDLCQYLGADPAHGLLSVCAWCESVRVSEQSWLPIGHYVPRESTIRITHGICPTCLDNMKLPAKAS